VIGSSSSQRRETSVRKHSVPSKVNKTPVQAHQGGDVTFVSPSELPIKEGDLKELKVVDEGVKSKGLAEIKGVIVFVRSISDQIEVTDYGPRPIYRPGDVRQFNQEHRLVCMSGRRVDVGAGEPGPVC
jgi:predicted RNA-binding protein with TRAM domain